MAGKRENVTLQHVADRAGVSRMTVSLALRNHPSLPAATRERVQAVAQAMGYQPDALVATLMTQLRTRRRPAQAHTIAFVNLWDKPIVPQAGTMFADYLDGASSRAQQLGYRIEPIWGKQPGLTGRRLSAILAARGIRGLLIGPSHVPHGHLTLDWSKFAAIVLGYSVIKPDLSRVSVDHYECVVLALRKLKRSGYRRVGFVVSAWTDERTGGRFQAAMLRYQQRLPKASQVPTLVTKAANRKEFSAWFEKYRPEVVLGSHSGILEWLEAMNCRVPGDVGFAHLHWEEAQHPCAGVYHRGRDIAGAGVDLLVGQLQRHEFGLPACPLLVLTRGEWKDGPTVRNQSRSNTMPRMA